MNNNTKQLMELMEQYPELPIVPMVHTEVVHDSDYYTRWISKIGESYIGRYICGKEALHFFDSEDLVEVLETLLDVRYQEWELEYLPDEKLDDLYKGLNWTTAIIVDIDPL